MAGIGLAAQTETFVVWDAGTGKPVYPAISWRDTRASDACAGLRAAGHEAEVRSRTGLPLEPAFSASKLRWLLDEVPGARRAAASGRLLFGDVDCWLTWQLSGGAVHVTDPSMACRTMLFDLAAGTWDQAMLDLFAIPGQMLPAVGATAGQLAVTDAAVCGGRAAISAIAGDQQAALFGQRCWTEGLAKLTLGTGAFLWCNAGPVPPAAATGRGRVHVRVADRAGHDLRPRGVRAQRRRGHHLAAAARRARRRGVAADQARRAGGWAGDEPGAPWCVPALFGLGTPDWTPLATAEIGGLTADSTGQDIAEAALIGVAQQIADAVDAVRSGLAGPLDLLRVDGGLGRNDSVLAAIADLTGLTLERSAAAEVTALGAGALAGLGAGQWDQAALAALPFETDRTVRPELPAAARQAARSAWRGLLADVVRRAGAGSAS